MNVGLRGAITVQLFHGITSQNTHLVTSVISFSLVLDVSVSGAVAAKYLQSSLRWNNIQVLNTRSSWSLLQQYAKIQKYLYDYDMTKGTLFELANPYPHTPITKHLSGIPDTADLRFWCVLKVIHMQFRLRCRINNYLCNRQSINVHTV